jgi:dihydrodipicolinate synthase/N-acetylneuraminate lyase
MEFEGVLPASTTPFREDLQVDLPALETHLSWLVRQGCSGVVLLGSVGEGATLEEGEKLSILSEGTRELKGKAPVVSAVSGLSTRAMAAFARRAERTGVDGLMLLPPYVHRGDAREVANHFDTLLSATSLPCLLYNNPILYGTDVSPELVESLADRHPHLAAVKESSPDPLRIPALVRRLGDRLRVLVGSDDMVLSGARGGARGWVSGVANALPGRSVDLWKRSTRKRTEDPEALYSWFLPLLKLDTVPKFVQSLKLLQSEVGRGNARVRPPRLPLEGPELHETLQGIRQVLSREVP